VQKLLEFGKRLEGRYRANPENESEKCVTAKWGVPSAKGNDMVCSHGKNNHELTKRYNDCLCGNDYLRRTQADEFRRLVLAD
jgi:hypothetical protein